MLVATDSVTLAGPRRADLILQEMLEAHIWGGRGQLSTHFPGLAHTETNASEARPSPQATTTVSPLRRINFCSETVFVSAICL